jgi:hypothetical protein
MLEVKEPQAPTLATGATWRAKDLLDTDVLSRDDIELVMESAEAMREVRSRPASRLGTLRGVTVVTLFYEQSTRTRASFEVAGKALGADVVNLTASGSSVEKGESLIDTVRTLEAIGADIVVMRHKSSGAPYLAARNTNASVINGGDGTHAHPTWAASKGSAWSSSVTCSTAGWPARTSGRCSRAARTSPSAAPRRCCHAPSLARASTAASMSRRTLRLPSPERMW